MPGVHRRGPSACGCQMARGSWLAGVPLAYVRDLRPLTAAALAAGCTLAKQAGSSDPPLRCGSPGIRSPREPTRRMEPGGDKRAEALSRSGGDTLDPGCELQKSVPTAGDIPAGAGIDSASGTGSERPPGRAA
ncbi:MAG: hypothetical protein Kow00128_15660 [Deltaproteobacteria bacterium]